MVSKLRRWLREGLILLVLLAGGAILMDAWRAPQVPPAFGSTALPTLDGETVTLASLSEERPVLLYFWASWCGICRFTTPDVARLHAEGENVMTIALRSGDAQTVMHGLARKGVVFPVVNDASGALSRSWAINVTPTLVVVSKGQVISTTSGWTSYWGMKLRLWWARTF
ncbi:protein disulfide oxidoreductase [Citrobacter amalonaticus]|uniref:Protein disulfide oxidoreductase n=1 Tax=Citrobacter amalonaticus TaxID=35703 RepID=A0A2S4RY90_CITAM|nr:protein disulfide oxidoreductase [Citrobacter amalonaticus]POT57805.1 protein disulfide oxidoreductase [Citrobacter amalonaticus]POT76668.1 protein disulfide oxidoreductase [Citrobacter amalonaticus]POU65747.1 protein disulfide oxidoreductase [Citrobacter amalonaticus]POV05904.1 protein disulfide oxidoreductase [Citrobacter amalonaticus]